MVDNAEAERKIGRIIRRDFTIPETHRRLQKWRESVSFTALVSRYAWEAAPIFIPFTATAGAAMDSRERPLSFWWMELNYKVETDHTQGKFGFWRRLKCYCCILFLLYFFLLKCNFSPLTFVKVSIWSPNFFCCNFGPLTFAKVSIWSPNFRKGLNLVP